jgi:hypothetical protein
LTVIRRMISISSNTYFMKSGDVAGFKARPGRTPRRRMSLKSLGRWTDVSFH